MVFVAQAVFAVIAMPSAFLKTRQLLRNYYHHDCSAQFIAEKGNLKCIVLYKEAHPSMTIIGVGNAS